MVAIGENDFRPFILFSLGSAVSLVGTWMQKIGVGWLGWSLTHSATWVGLLAFCDLFPTVLAAPIAGAIADRFSPLLIIRVTQILAVLQAAALFGLVAGGVLGIGGLLALCLIQGLIDGFNQPVRMGLVSQLIAPAHLPRGVALGSIIFNLARCVGPALAGVLLVKGDIASVFLANTIATLCFVGALFRLRVAEPAPSRRRVRAGGLAGDIVQGIRYAVNQPVIAPVLILLIVVCTLVRPYAELLPGMVGTLFDGRPETLALLTTANAAGALLGGLVLMVRRHSPSRLTAQVFGAGFCFALSVIVFAAGGGLPVAVPTLVVAGFFQVITMVSIQSLIQLTAEPALRGRVLSLYGMLFRGGPGLGALVVGLTAEGIGLGPSLEIAAALAVLASALLARRQTKGQETILSPVQ